MQGSQATDSYDAAIIGTGPAGANAAYQCSKLGLKTAVFEEHKVAGEPVHCGECLSDLCIQKFLPSLPKSAISLPVKGIRVIFPDKTSTVLNEPGVVLEKHKFEQYLSDEAEKLNANYFYSTRVSAMEFGNGGWTINSDSKSFKSKIVIDASGVAQAGSRLANLGQKSETVLGAQFEMDDIPQDGYIDFYLWPRLAPHGYLWMIPKSDGRANVGLVTTDKPKIKAYLDQFVKEMGWQDKKIAKAFGGLIPCSGPLPATYSDGLMLIGDAAGFTSPMFEGGTHLSISSGNMAAKVAKKAIDSGDNSKRALAEYENLWRAEFPDYKTLIVGKDALYSYSDNELNQIVHAMGPDLTHLGFLGKAKFAVKIAAANPGLYGKKLIKAMNAFAYSQAKFYGW